MASDKPQYGLEELSGPKDADVDIVFVHGLFGDRRQTWTKNGICWPETLLPDDLPTARILTFGYDADAVKRNAADEVTRRTIETHAADLCEELVGVRGRTDSSTRPLIFVAHSLGGLICARAITAGYKGDKSSNFSIITSNTRGIIYLGTPFQGSPAAPWGQTIGKIIAVFRDTDLNKIDSLNENSGKLKLIAEDFATALFQRKGEKKEILINFFHETKKYRGATLVVPEANSRIMGVGDHSSLNADHRSMCKFADRDTEGYKKILGAIQRAADAKPKDEEETVSTYIPISAFAFSNIQQSRGIQINNNNNWGNQVLGDQTIHGNLVFGRT